MPLLMGINYGLKIMHESLFVRLFYTDHIYDGHCFIPITFFQGRQAR